MGSCRKCHKSKCSCSSGNDMAQLLNELAEMRQQLDEVSAGGLKAFKCGHPIVAITETDDIASFDTESGLGSGCWENWAICSGATYLSTSGKRITTRDLRNNFLVGAGDNYNVGDAGGANTVTLSSAQMPAHTHAVTDPGHNHSTTQTAHSHGVTQSPHNHAVTDPGHDHVMNVTQNPNFTSHSLIEETLNVDSGSGNDVPNTWSNSTDSYSVSVDADPAQTGLTVDNASITISVNTASVNISIDNETTGITNEETGGGEAHENRPPYVAVLFVMYIG